MIDNDTRCTNCNHPYNGHTALLSGGRGKCVYSPNCNCNNFSTMLNDDNSKFQGVTEFIELLRLSKDIHLRKGADYTSNSNPFSNFERSAELISWFNNPVDKSFIALIGTKLARIAELSDGRTPNNESLDDSFLDLLTYCGLWAAYVKRNRKTTL